MAIVSLAQPVPTPKSGTVKFRAQCRLIQRLSQSFHLELGSRCRIHVCRFLPSQTKDMLFSTTALCFTCHQWCRLMPVPWIIQCAMFEHTHICLHDASSPGIFWLFLKIRVGVAGDHRPSTPLYPPFFYLFALPFVNNTMTLHPITFPAFDFSLSSPPLWKQFTTTLGNYLSILYLFTYSDHKTVLIPVVCLASYPHLFIKNRVFYRPPLLTSQPAIQAPIVCYTRVSGRGPIFS